MNHFTAKDITLKARSKTSHKGQNGTVLVLGGSEQYIGSPAFVGMSALATLRAGADLVHIAAPEHVAWAINCISADLITHKLPGKTFSPRHIDACLKLATQADVIVIGNGIGRLKTTRTFVQTFLKKNNKPLVIDADALRMIRIQDIKNAILTPHEDELKTLLKNSNLTRKNFKNALGNNILIQKGHPDTYVHSARRTAHISVGHAGMTHGGTGDVLAGLIAGLWAQTNPAFMSACTAVYINGKAGEQLAKQYGVGYIASDLIKVIPTLLKKHIKNR